MQDVRNRSTLAIAGVNTHPLSNVLKKSVLGIAGNLSTTLRPRVMAEVGNSIGRKTLGDRAANSGWDNTCMLLDYTYIACTNGKRGGERAMQWRNGFADHYSVANRAIPLVFDSSAFRDSKGRGEPWSSYETYCETIDLIRPDAVMARDVIGDQRASYDNYLRMVTDGYGDLTIPVWQMRQAFDRSLSPEENGAAAARDPILRAYAAAAPMVAIGGLLYNTQLPVKQRAAYLTAIAEALPDVRLWGLGQASGTVVNGLGLRGMLGRISVDGSWWIQAAKAEQIAILDDGLLRALTFARTGKQTFFTYTEVMACNLRALKAAYDGLWSFPGPSKVPDDLADMDQVVDLARRVKSAVQTDFMGLLA